ncbi:MAG: hypothetical protein QXY76_03295 [Nitrososphaeria archaeon]
MAEREIKLQTSAGYRLLTDMINKLGELPLKVLSLYIDGMFTGYGIIGSYSNFLLRYDNDTWTVSPGLIFLPGIEDTKRFIYNDSTKTLSVGQLGTGKTYFVYVAYREDFADPITENPYTGELISTTVISVLDESSAIVTSLPATPQVSFYFLDALNPPSLPETAPYFLLGKVTVSTSGSITVDASSTYRVFPKYNLFWAEVGTPSVDDYTNILDFLSCKGSGSRTVRNPFGLAMQDLTGIDPSLIGSAISCILRIPPNYPDSGGALTPITYLGASNQILLKALRGDELIIVGGKVLGLGEPPQIGTYAGTPIATFDPSNNIVVSPPQAATQFGTYQLWCLGLVYTPETDIVSLEWIGLNGANVELNRPLFSTNNLNALANYIGEDSSAQSLSSYGIDVLLKPLTDVSIHPSRRNNFPLLIIGVQKGSNFLKFCIYYNQSQAGGIP